MIKFGFFALLCLLLTAFNAQAVEKPSLQIELGGHSAPVRRIDVVPERDIVVTVSDDKSARVWRLSTRRLLHILRPAAGPDSVGRLYGVAIHPTLDQVAVAGSTSIGADGHQILIFKLTTGQLLRSFDARGGDIKKMAWSKDGLALLAVYAGDNGLRAFNTAGTLIFEKKFDSRSYGLDVTANTIAASTLSGNIHLFHYQSGKISAAGLLRGNGKNPVGVAFSPDGNQLAVGYFVSLSSSDGPEIFDVKTKSSILRLSYPRLEDGNLMTVAWSGDGQYLVAGGTSWQGAKPRFVAFQYDAQSGALAKTHQLARDSIFDMHAIDATTLAFASFDGSWGTVEMAHEKVVSTGAQLQDFRGARNLKISDDARQISVGISESQEPAWFDLNTRLLRYQQPTKALKPPLIKTGAVWQNNRLPKLSGKSIELQLDEVSRSIAWFNKSEQVILGTSKSLIRLDENGSVRWRIASNAEVQSVNISANDKIAVTAMSDGTIRWWKTHDGQLLLSALIRRDRQWIVWTPDGHFDASAGADRIVGWAVNRSDQPVADFFSLNRFRRQLNHPATIDQIFSKRQYRSTVPPQFPPVLSADDLPDTSDSLAPVRIRFTMRARVGANVQVRVNGRPAPSAKVLLPKQFDGLSQGQVSLTRPAPGSVIQLVGRDEHGASEPLGFLVRPPTDPPDELESVPAVSAPTTSDPRDNYVSINRVQQARLAETELKTLDNDLTTTALPDRRSRSKLFVLAIGISEYKDTQYRLGFAAKDAKDFLAAVKTMPGNLYGDITTRAITNRQASRSAIVEGLQWLTDSVNSNDVGMLFIAGHGVNSDDGQYYFLPYEGDHARLSETSVPETAIRDTLGNMRGRALFFVDTCYAGNALGNLRTASRELAHMANDLAAAENGVVVFASSSGRQLSVEDVAWGNGAFTKALIEGLSGKADLTGTGRITYKGLDFYISEQVNRLTGGRQTPVTIAPIGVPDFAISQ